MQPNEDVVVYDMDSADEEFLESINGEQKRLGEYVYERMVQVLEYANAAANEK